MFADRGRKIKRGARPSLTSFTPSPLRLKGVGGIDISIVLSQSTHCRVPRGIGSGELQRKVEGREPRLTS